MGEKEKQQTTGWGWVGMSCPTALDALSDAPLRCLAAC